MSKEGEVVEELMLRCGKCGGLMDEGDGCGVCGACCCVSDH